MTRRLLTRTSLALASLVAAASAACAAPEPVASLDAWRGDLPGGVVLAVVDSTGTHFFASGTFSQSRAEALGPDTFFEAGSVTKVFTTLLLADAVQRGEVRLDEAIAARTDLPAPASLTFVALATHHSGLPRLPAEFTPADPADPYADQDSAKLRAALARFAPGSAAAPFAYSNLGAAVLGLALSRRADTPYEQLLRERVLVPLGMNEAGLDWRGVDRARLAPGHAAGASAPNWTFDAYAPAGGLVASARELALLVEVALGRRESSLAPALQTCLEPRAETEQADTRVGLGWMITERPDHTTITWHNGATGGYRSFVGMDRAAGRGVVLLANRDTPLEPLAHAVLAGTAFAPARAQPPTPGLAAYVGRYPLAASFVLTVSAEGAQLFVQATGQPRLGLRADGTDRFAVEGVDAALTFERDAAGSVTAVVLHQNGADQRAPRRDGPEPVRQEVVLDAATLAGYAGRYPLAPGFELVVSVEDGALFVQATRQPKFPVFATARDEFFYKVVDAQLSFVRGQGGDVVAVILHQNGRDLRGPKTPP